MKLISAGLLTKSHKVAASISVRMVAGKPGSAVNRLMSVATEMLQTNNITGLTVLRLLGANCLRQKENLRQSVKNLRRFTKSASRVRNVDEMPILVHEFVCVTGILCIRGLAGGSISPVRFIAGAARSLFDTVGPSCAVKKCHKNLLFLAHLLGPLHVHRGELEHLVSPRTRFQ